MNGWGLLGQLKAGGTAVADAIKTARQTQIDRALADQKIPGNIAEHLKADLDNSVSMLLKARRGTGNFGYRIMISTAAASKP